MVSETSRRQHGPVARGTGRCSAFTLIELVVAMAIVAIMGVSLYASVRIAFKSQASAEAAVEPSRTAELAMEFIRQDLDNACPPAGNNGQIALATGRLCGDFIGSDSVGDNNKDSDDLNFFTTAEATLHPSANGEVKNVELLVVNQNNSAEQVLVRRVTRNLLSALVPTPDEEVLCRGVVGFNVRYYDGTTWNDAWDSTVVNNALPTAVEVMLELERPNTLGGVQTFRFTRVFIMSCATPPSDDTSESGSAQ